MQTLKQTNKKRKPLGVKNNGIIFDVYGLIVKDNIYKEIKGGRTDNLSLPTRIIKCVLFYLSPKKKLEQLNYT